MKKLFCILMFSMLTFSLAAQEFEVPTNYEFKQDDDYSKYEEEVLKGIDWVLQTPLNEQPQKRKEVNTFIVTWLQGTPKVCVDLSPLISNVMITNPDPNLLMVFMCGWTKYALENKDYDNLIKGNQKGVEALMEFYLKNRDNLKKNKTIEKYIKLNQEGKLDDYILKNVR